MTSRKNAVVARRIALGFLIALTVGMTAGGAEAASGDILRSITVPWQARCNDGTTDGTAVTVVPGSKAGYPQIPLLLVTSCVQQFFPDDGDGVFQTTLFFLDPVNTVEGEAEFVAMLPLPPSTPSFRSLVLRADQGDIVGCMSGEGSALYSIHFSTFDPLVGTVSLLRNLPDGNCNGIAWDPSDQSVYVTTLGANLLKIAPTGSAAGTDVPHGCDGGRQARGVHVAGVSLLVACSGSEATNVIRQLNKATPFGLVASSELTGESVPSRAADLEYDSVTFASMGKDAVWINDTFSTTLYAAEVAFGTIAQTSGTPVAFPAACPAGYPTNPDGSAKDTDGDALLDCWEDGTLWTDGLPGIGYSGVYGNPTGRDVTLCVDANNANGFGAAGSAERATECASVTVKDIFVEIDYMQFHRPDAAAVTSVVTSFLNAPFDAGAGVRLHIQIGEQLAHKTRIALFPCTGPFNPADADSANFDQLKASFFGTPTERATPNGRNAKRLAYHYLIFAHNLAPIPPAVTNTSSGCAEVPGNDGVVTLGSFGGAVTGHTGGVGTSVQQAGTLMHELGHNLNLRHGGFDNTNCKPNYPSVMNYSYQFPSPVTTRPLDFSRQTLTTLTELALDESVGLVALLPGEPEYTGKIAFGPPVGIPAKPTVVTSSTTGINWNRNTAVDAAVSQDINVLTSVGCAAFPGANGETLEGFNDWANLQFNFRASVDFADGGHITVDPTVEGGTLDMGIEEAKELSLDSNGNGVLDIDDECPTTPGGTSCTVKIKVVGAAVLNGPQPGFLRLAILGAADRDVRKIIPESVVLHGAEVNGTGVWALRVTDDASGTPQCVVRSIGGGGSRDLVCQLEITQGQLPRDLSRATVEALSTLDDGTTETLRGAVGIHVRRVSKHDVVTGF